MNGTCDAGDVTRRALAGLLRISEPPAPALVALVEAIGPVAAWEAVRHRDCTSGGCRRSCGSPSRGWPIGHRRSSSDLAERDLAVAEAAGARLIGPERSGMGGRAPSSVSDIRVRIPSAGRGAPRSRCTSGGSGCPPMNSSVAMVGSRAATPYGIRAATELAADLVVCRITVVSGAAFGIDAAAHRGALHAASTGASTSSRSPCWRVASTGRIPVAHAGLLDAIASDRVWSSRSTRPARHRPATGSWSGTG